MIKNNQSHYGWLSIVMHWLSAIVVFAMFGVGLWMVDLSYYSEWYQTAPHWHKSIGILLALLLVFRFVWNTLQGKPKPLGSRLENVAAKFAHGVIYLLLLLIVVSGYLISTADDRPIEVFTWFAVPSLGELFENQADIAGELHFYFAAVLIGLAIIHGLAALKHHFIDKDATLTRMLKFKQSVK